MPFVEPDAPLPDRDMLERQMMQPERAAKFVAVFDEACTRTTAAAKAGAGTARRERAIVERRLANPIDALADGKARPVCLRALTPPRPSSPACRIPKPNRRRCRACMPVSPDSMPAGSQNAGRPWPLARMSRPWRRPARLSTRPLSTRPAPMPIRPVSRWWASLPPCSSRPVSRCQWRRPPPASVLDTLVSWVKEGAGPKSLPGPWRSPGLPFPWPAWPSLTSPVRRRRAGTVR